MDEVIEVEDVEQQDNISLRQRHKPVIPAHYLTWPSHIFTLKYLRLFKSPSFIFTFGIAIVSRINAFVDVVTDYAQAFEHWIGGERGFCGRAISMMNTTIRTNITDFTAPTTIAYRLPPSTTATITSFADVSIYTSNKASSNVTLDPEEFLYAPKDPVWFTITVVSIFLPAFLCTTRHSVSNLRSQFLFHHFRIVCEEAKENEDATSCKSYLQKLLLFLVLPPLIIARQIRQLLLILEIEYNDHMLAESMTTKMTTKKRNVGKGSRLMAIRRRERKKDVVAVIHTVLSNPSYIPPVRTELTDQLISLSVDRHDEALLETTPQTILNLMVMFRNGSDLLRQLSLSFSIFSLVSSTAAYTTDKLKLNPVKRELNHLGKFLTFLMKFPVTLSRCIVLSTLYSTQNHMVKIGFSVFFLAYGLFAMFLEYLCLDFRHRFMSWQLIQQLIIRGYTSLFTLMEYRLKRCEKNGKIFDEADLEAQEGISEDPPSRFWYQVIYLVFNCIINTMFGIWFYFYSSEQICATGFFLSFFDFVPELSLDIRLFWTVVMLTGAPLSLSLTIFMNFRKIRNYTTTLGLKAIVALNCHVRTTIKKANQKDLRNLLSLLSSLSKEECRQAASINDTTDKHSVLYQVIGFGLQLFIQFRDMGFPIKGDLEEFIKLTVKEDVREVIYSVLGESASQIDDILNRTHIISNSTSNERRAISSAWMNEKSPQLSTFIPQLQLLPLSLFPVPSNVEDVVGSPENAAVVAGEGVVYIISRSSIDDYSQLVRYDVIERTFTVTRTNGSVPAKLRNSLCVLVGNTIYVFGSCENTQMANLYLLNTKTFVWSCVRQDGEIKTLRQNQILWCWNGDIWMIEGMESSNESVLHKLNTTTNTWSTLESTGTSPSRRKGVAHWEKDGILYLYGGQTVVNDSVAYSNEVFMLDMKSLIWSTVESNEGSIKLPSVERAAICVHSDKLFILGGKGSSGNHATLYFLNLSSGKVEELRELASLKDGERKEDDKDGKTIGLCDHHLFVMTNRNGEARLVVVGGNWGTEMEDFVPSSFIVEFDIDDV